MDPLIVESFLFLILLFASDVLRTVFGVVVVAPAAAVAATEIVGLIVASYPAATAATDSRAAAAAGIVEILVEIVEVGIGEQEILEMLEYLPPAFGTAEEC